jgi:hypothetical protein
MDRSIASAGSQSGNAVDRLTVLVGAGASVELGVPSTGDATRQLVEGEPGDADGRLTRDQLQMLRQTLNVLGQWAPKSRPNFEHLLHCLEVVITMQNAWRAAGSGHLRTMFSLVTGGPRADLLPLFEGRLAANAVAYFFRRLHSIFSGHNPRQNRPGEWCNYQGFWDSLASKYRLDIATTNYDDLLETALPQLNQGFQQIPGEDTKRFSPHALRKTESRLVHLHGSIHWGYRSGAADVNRFAFQDSWHDLYWHDDPLAAQRSWGWRSNQRAQSGEELIVGPMLSGLQKPDKVLSAEPYATYYRSLGDWLEHNRRLIIVGYGFGDDHINDLITRLTSWHGPERKVAVITLLDEKEWDEIRHSHERMSENMAIKRWSEDDDTWFDQMFKYQDLWTSKNGLCRVYLGGLLHTSRAYLSNLLQFIA